VRSARLISNYRFQTTTSISANCTQRVFTKAAAACSFGDHWCFAHTFTLCCVSLLIGFDKLTGVTNPTIVY
jgi:hypothetical protein